MQQISREQMFRWKARILSLLVAVFYLIAAVLKRRRTSVPEQHAAA